MEQHERLQALELLVHQQKVDIEDLRHRLSMHDLLLKALTPDSADNDGSQVVMKHQNAPAPMIATNNKEASLETIISLPSVVDVVRYAGLLSATALRAISHHSASLTLTLLSDCASKKLLSLPEAIIPAATGVPFPQGLFPGGGWKAAFVRGCVYVLRDEEVERVAKLHEFTVGVDEWNCLATPRLPVMAGFAACRGKLCVAGGQSVERSACGLAVDILPETGTASCEPIASLLTARWQHAAVGIKSKLYVVGGYAGQESIGGYRYPIQKPEAYDYGTGSWHSLPDLPDCAKLTKKIGRAHVTHEAASCSGTLFVLVPLPDARSILCSYQSQQWSTVGEPLPRCCCMCFSWAGCIYIVGGQNSNLAGDKSYLVEAYNPGAGEWEPVAATAPQSSGLSPLVALM